MTIGYVRSHGGTAVRKLHGWDITWPDEQKWSAYVFTARESGNRENVPLLTLENSRVRALALHIPRLTPGQLIPGVVMPGLPDRVSGLWGLFEIRLQRTVEPQSRQTADELGGLVQIPLLRRGYCAVFISEQGKVLMPTARHIWDALQNAEYRLNSVLEQGDSEVAYERLQEAMENSGRDLFAKLEQEHQAAVRREEERGRSAFSARRKMIERVGLPEVRRHRQAECEADEKVWREELALAQKVVPEMRPLLFMRIDPPGDEMSGLPCRPGQSEDLSPESCRRAAAVVRHFSEALSEKDGNMGDGYA